MDPNLECCVLGCHTRPNQGLRFYRFPCHNHQISSIWEQRIWQSGNIDFLHDHVCELHFHYHYKTGNDCALEEGSLPTLNLPNFDNRFISTDSAYFQMSDNRIESSYTISKDSLSYHCRFCLSRGLLYDVEASTYRSKSFLSLIDLPSNVLPDNIQPNACLNCLKSIVIAHRLSMATEYSNTIVQKLQQCPKQSKVVSHTNFFDMKSELALCNLIPSNSLSIKLEIDIEDNMVWANENYEQKWVGTGEPKSPAVFVNTQNVVGKSISLVENQYNISNICMMPDSDTSDKQSQKQFHKSFAIEAEYTINLSAERIPDTSEKSDSCALTENTDDNADVMVSNTSDDFCAEDREFDNEQAPVSTSDNLVIHKNLHLAGQRKSSTLTDKNKHWNENDSVYVCPICDWKNTSFLTFNVHMDKHAQTDKYCVIGSEELETLEADPVRNGDGRYQCTEYQKAFSDKSNFSRHKRILPYRCTECPKTFITTSQFAIHKIIHTNVKPYKCTECPKTFSNKGNFDIHKKIHTNESPYKSTEWPKNVIEKGQFSVHTNERSYKCTECLKSFHNQRAFIQHEIVHTIKRPYKCSECPIAFRWNSALILHKRIHTNERPFKCTECPDTFITNSRLSIHKRIHTNERPYKCTECPKAYRCNSILINHKRLHTNERPYKCTECPKTYTIKSNLDIHKRIHTNERPYKCTECPKAYRSNSSLIKHKRIHTNERSSKCSEFPKAFNYSTSFSRHKKRKHE